jgi:hypothetical protein
MDSGVLMREFRWKMWVLIVDRLAHGAIGLIIGLLLSVSYCHADPIDMTTQITVDGKNMKDPTTHDPGDWTAEGKDLDPTCAKCLELTIGGAIYTVLTSIRRDETPMPPMPAQEGWKAFADRIKAQKAIALTPGQIKLIEDRVDKIIVIPGLATAIKKAIDPTYQPKEPE